MMRPAFPPALTMKLFCSLIAATLAAVPTAHAAEAPVFPQKSAAKSVRGELLSADYVHRTGVFRAEDGSLVCFSMPPYGIMRLHGAEADMREVPLGSKLTFQLLSDEDGHLTRLLTTDDGHQGPPDAAQVKRFADFTVARGVAGWIDKTEGNLVTVTFFSSDPQAFKQQWGAAFALNKSGGKLCVANDELRTWNPPVDGEGFTITEVREVPAENVFGCSGLQVVLKVSNMLEGFRRGRVVRVFASGWKAGDQFYGESLMGYGFGRMLNEELVENVAKEYPEQLPYRTDFGNRELPWFQVRPGMSRLPEYSAHTVMAELVSVDATARGGQYRLPGSDKVVAFTLLEKPVLKRLGNECTLEALAVGQLHRFHTYQDTAGAFTRVSMISDEFSHLVKNVTTGRITAINLDQGWVDVGLQLAEVKDYNGDMKRAPDFAQRRIYVNASTRVWKDAVQTNLKDLAKDDVVLFNLSGKEPLSCTDLWIGEDTHKLVIEKQRQTLAEGKAAKK